MKKVLLTASIMSFIGWLITIIILDTKIMRDCGGYLERAANASTVAIATGQLEIALEYLEENELTKGSTHLLYWTPSSDLGYWYQNLKTLSDDLKKLDTDKLSSLEESNTLMRLREVILDNGTITSPVGISRYPANKLFAVWGFGSFVAILVAALNLMFMKELWRWINNC